MEHAGVGSKYFLMQHGGNDIQTCMTDLFTVTATEDTLLASPSRFNPNSNQSRFTSTNSIMPAGFIQPVVHILVNEFLLSYPMKQLSHFHLH